MVRKILLGCGIVSSVLYVITDVLGTLRYPGYSYANQTFSELTAVGSPVRPLMIASSIPGTLLVGAFAAGVWTSATPKRAARITGAMLLGYTLTGMVTGGSSRRTHVRPSQQARRGCATPCTPLGRS